MNIFVLRHGQTILNVEGKFQGRIDTELTKVGKDQIKQSKEDLSKIKFDLIFVSPLKRTIETVKILTNQEFLIDERIIERSFGKLEGKASIPDYEKKIQQYEIESLESVKERVYSFLNELKEKYSNKNNILIVTHEGIAQNINAFFNEIKDIKNFRLENGKYVKYTILNQEQLMKKLENDELKRSKSNLKKQEIVKTDIKKDSIHIVYLMVWTKVCGGSKIILEYANRLSLLGNKVTIISYDEKPFWFNLNKKIEFIKIPINEKMEDFIPNCDVIVPTSWKNIYQAIKSQKAPVTFFEQGGSHIFETNNMPEKKAATVKDRINLVPFIHTVSTYTKLKIKDFYEKEAEVICNAIDNRYFYPRDDLKKQDNIINITIIGSEKFRFKNINESLEAIRKIKLKYSNLKLNWITQDKPIFNKEEAIINPKQEMIGEILRNTDIFICNSEYESFCLPVLEAMSCGVAVITTDNGGISDFVNDTNAIIIEKHNQLDLIEKIEYLINNKNKRIELMKNGLETAKKFSWQNSVKLMDEYYKKIAKFNIVTDSEIDRK